MQPTPVGETGGSKGQGRRTGRGLTRPARSAAEEGWGYPVWRASAFTLAQREGLAPEGCSGCCRPQPLALPMVVAP